MAREINTRIQHKLDTVANWEAVKDTFVPLSGELIIYKGNNNYNFKIGDGTNKLKDLPFTDNVQLTIKQNGQSKGTFKANLTSDVTVELTNQTVKRNGTTFGDSAAVDIVPGTNVTISGDGDQVKINAVDTWKPNTASQEGYVAAGGTPNKVWRTDGEGTPGWGDWTTANNGTLTIKQNNTLKGTFTANQATGTEVNLTDTIPNNGKLTITQNGVNKGEFTANQADAKTIEVTDTTYTKATSSNLGLVKIGYTSTTSDKFAVQLDSDGKMYVNVPVENGKLSFTAGQFAAKDFTANNADNVTVNVPTNTSHLSNDSNFVTRSEVQTMLDNFAETTLFTAAY